MVHVPKEKKLKWDKKTVIHVLAGCSDSIKGYRLCNPNNNTMFTSRDVTIMENVKQPTIKVELNSDPCSV